jgi:hypothetical protein
VAALVKEMIDRSFFPLHKCLLEYKHGQQLVQISDAQQGWQLVVMR